MAAHVRISLVEKMCEHCPSEERGWVWFFETVGNQVVLVVRCKKCEAQHIFTQKDMHGHLAVEQIPAAAASEPAVPPAGPARTVVHSRTYTPYDRKLMQRLGIATDGIEFEK